jgi:hypothetical protein
MQVPAVRDVANCRSTFPLRETCDRFASRDAVIHERVVSVVEAEELRDYPASLDVRISKVASEVRAASGALSDLGARSLARIPHPARDRLKACDAIS